MVSADVNDHFGFESESVTMPAAQSMEGLASCSQGSPRITSSFPHWMR